uniref:Uncharacterized protein n=1 Tax=Setaria italica TaxID=4555 RepID=K4AIB8_SETIT
METIAKLIVAVYN